MFGRGVGVSCSKVLLFFSLWFLLFLLLVFCWCIIRFGLCSKKNWDLILIRYWLCKVLIFWNGMKFLLIEWMFLRCGWWICWVFCWFVCLVVCWVMELGVFLVWYFFWLVMSVIIFLGLFKLIIIMLKFISWIFWLVGICNYRIIVLILIRCSMFWLMRLVFKFLVLLIRKWLLGRFLIFMVRNGW